MIHINGSQYAVILLELPVTYNRTSLLRLLSHSLLPNHPLISLQVFILEELLSPVVTPIILIFCLRKKSLEIIDFFRNFTVEVVGVGDTCSFAQMDIRQHGHPAVENHCMKHS